MLKVQTQKLPNGQELKTVVIPATIVGISESIRQLKNAKQTPFQLGTVMVHYPTKEEGKTIDKQANATIWTASLTQNKEMFQPGSKVAVRVQIDGDYKGYGKIELPETTRVDMALLEEFIVQDEPVQN